MCFFFQACLGNNSSTYVWSVSDKERNRLQQSLQGNTNSDKDVQHHRPSDLVRQWRAAGFNSEEIRIRLKGMNYKLSRISQLLRVHCSLPIVTEVTPKYEDKQPPVKKPKRWIQDAIKVPAESSFSRDTLREQQHLSTEHDTEGLQTPASADWSQSLSTKETVLSRDTIQSATLKAHEWFKLWRPTTLLGRTIHIIANLAVITDACGTTCACNTSRRLLSYVQSNDSQRSLSMVGRQDSNWISV